MERKYILMMDKHMLNKYGFSMIETVFVLCIVSIISIFTIQYYSYDYDDEYIIYHIRYSLYQAKLNSMIYKEKTNIEFVNDLIPISS